MTVPLDSDVLRLKNDVQIPALGFGTYLISENQVEGALDTAISAGYRHVDTAEAYENEKGVGRALAKAFTAGLRRDDMFVTTKLFPGNPDWGLPAKNFGTTTISLDNSLDRLGLDYVDLYLIHSPMTPSERINQWRGLVELRDQGKARAIGVSNYSKIHIEEIRAAGLPLPEVNQIELHPWSQKRELVKYLRENSICVVAYSSLVPLDTWRTAAGHDSAKTQQMRVSDGTLEKIAKKYQVGEARVLLRWGVQQGFAVLPKSTVNNRIFENADLFSFSLDEADMADLAGMERGTAVAWSMGDPIRLP